MRGKCSIFINLFIFLIFISTASYSASKLAAVKSEYDFGSIREGINVPVSFNIINKGTDVAQINQVRTFAACVELKPLPKQRLAPGESVELNYIFQSLGYGGVSIDKAIEIHYNNSHLSPLRLHVKGKVLPLESYQAPAGELIYNFFVLIDIRPSEEFIREHIMGAINIPYQKIEDWAAAVADAVTEDIVIYLYSEDGRESDQAAKRLRTKGFSQYLSLVGGLKEWKRQYGQKLIISEKF